jgi:hypothetical protein
MWSTAFRGVIELFDDAGGVVERRRVLPPLE